MALVFSFFQPAWLLLLPVCIVTVWIMAKTRRGKFANQLAAFRSLIVILLVLSLAGVSFRRFSNTTAVLMAVDISDSMDGAEADILRFLKEASGAMGKGDLAGVVSFGRYAAVEQMPSVGLEPLSLGSVVEKDATDISQALKLAQVILPQDTKKRVVVISDGFDNDGDALSYVRQLREQGIVTDVVPMGGQWKDEAQVASVTVPKTIPKNVIYDIDIRLQSVAENSGRLLLYKNDRLIADQEVKLRAGENMYRLTDTSDTGGGVIYRTELRPSADTFYQNNTAYAYGYVEDEPKILLADYDGSGEEWARLLEGANVSTVKVDAQALPMDYAAIHQYDGVILPDIPIDSMPEAFPEVLESYVINTGGGVIVTGGENAYGPGGYHGTSLERLLPVDMDMKDTEDIPVLAMVLVLDRSGSMSGGNYGVSKLSLAKEAAIRSIDSLLDGDFFGVLAFDDGNLWASPMQQVQTNREVITHNIASISPGGGTSILPALREAYDVLSGTEAKTKHIVLLTDGQAEQIGYDSLLAQMESEAITLSAIAVGSDADVNLLRDLAKRGNGRYYFSNEFTDLPKIFTKETKLAGKAYLNHIDFYPMVKEASPILNGIDSLPVLHGYVSTTGKARADIALVSHEDEPVLAAWQYGLGRAVAWCSDASGEWSADFLSREQGAGLFRNMVSYAIRRQMTGAIDVTVTPLGAEYEIIVSIPYSDGVRGIKGGLIAPDGREIPVTWEAIAPGSYRALLNEKKEGAYIVNLTVDKLSGEELFSTGVAIGFPPEYDIDRQIEGDAFLKRLAAAGGGRVIQNPAQIFDPVEETVYHDRPLSDALLWMAVVLFVIEIALRRFPVMMEKTNEILRRMVLFLKRRRRETDIIAFEEKKQKSDHQTSKIDAPRRDNKAKTSSMLLDRKNRRTSR